MKKLSVAILCSLSLIFTSCATLDAFVAVAKTMESVSKGGDGTSAPDQNKNAKQSDEERQDAIAASVMTALEEITPEDQYVIGRAVASSVIGKYSLYENKAATEYLNKILAVIVRNSENPYLYKGYFVAILDTDEVNAISSPGGHIFITRGLINQAKSEDELAAVISHEVAHIQLGHAIQSIRATRILDATSKIWAEIDYNKGTYSKEELEDFNKTREGIFSTLVESGFSKAQEFNADENALVLMKDAGYDPKCMIDLLNTLKSNTSGSGWSKTHPKPSNRIEKSQKKLNKINFNGSSKEVRQKRFDAAKTSF